MIYEVFNPDNSVGVACDRSGLVVGLHIGDVWEQADSWLAAEILRVARLARMKSQVGRRAELLYNGMSPHVADSLRLPTEADYNLMEKAEFGDGF
ncbi:MULTISPECIES: hypothetical protein [Nocardia]|uniref:hypothetical protein n=1 Tax=Nocardia abscessus TaxID=120957 RepID=UPI002456EB39|nr:hypothetical protein [Nocardia abscessus]